MLRWLLWSLLILNVVFLLWICCRRSWLSFQLDSWHMLWEPRIQMLQVWCWRSAYTCWSDSHDRFKLAVWVQSPHARRQMQSFSIFQYWECPRCPWTSSVARCFSLTHGSRVKQSDAISNAHLQRTVSSGIFVLCGQMTHCSWLLIVLKEQCSYVCLLMILKFKLSS